MRWATCRWRKFGAEFLFQVIAERAERNAVIMDHQPAVFRVDAGDSRTRGLCKAVLDPHHRPAHILETGTESYRFRRSINKAKERRKKVRDEMSYGNAGPWKAWESQKQASHLSTVLGNPARTAGFHISHSFHDYLLTPAKASRLAETAPKRVAKLNCRTGPNSVAKRNGRLTISRRQPFVRHLSPRLGVPALMQGKVIIVPAKAGGPDRRS